MSLTLNIRRYYDDVSLSHLAVMDVYSSDADDPHIFICADSALAGGPATIPDQLVGVYEEVEWDDMTEEVVTVDPAICVPQYRAGVWYEYLAQSVEEIDLKIYPNRVLQAIASPTDMGTYPVDAPAEGNTQDLYRAANVSIMTNSLASLNEIIDLVYEDFIHHGEAMDSLTTDVVLHECVPYIDPDNDKQYIFPEK